MSECFCFIGKIIFLIYILNFNLKHKEFKLPIRRQADIMPVLFLSFLSLSLIE